MSRHSANFLADHLLPLPQRVKASATRHGPLKLLKSAGQDSSCTFSIVTTRAGFDALEADWCDLFDRASTGAQVFQNFHWLWHWCNHFLPDRQAQNTLAIVTAYSAEKLVMVWPLCVQRSGALKQLTWMGHPVSQYGDALIDPREVNAQDLRAAWNFLTKHISADVIHLRKVRADGAVGDLMRAVCREPQAQQTAPYLDLSHAQSFDDYQKRYSGKARKNRRRLRRRVEERATLSVETNDTSSECAPIASQAITMKRVWLKARGLVSPAIQDERTRLFFQAAAASSNHPTGCRTTALQIGEEVAAIEVSFLSKGHCAVHVIVYHMDYEKAGAGVLLMEEGIKSAIAANVKTFDLLAPGDNYKLDWADGAVNVYDWCLPLSPLGRAYHALGFNKLPGMIKALLSALPLSIRQILHRGFARTR